MDRRYFGVIIFFLTIILLIWYVSLIMKTSTEGFKIKRKKKKEKHLIGATNEHLELAYRLCSDNSNTHCMSYISHFDNLKQSFRKLKKGFCKKYPKRCHELNID